MKKPQAVKWNRFRYPALSHETLDAMVYDAEQMDLFLEEQKQKLGAIRVIVAEYPKCDKTGLAFEWDELITRILAILDTPAQNTEVNHA